MPGKRYGSRMREVKPVPFEFELYRDTPEADEPVAEVHEFTAMPRIDAGQLIRLLSGVDRAEDNPGDMLNALSESVRRVLSNKDGTPQAWAPVALPREDGDEQGPISFRGPDGSIYPFSDQAAIDKFTAFEAGSSRRRWAHLLFDDEGVAVNLEDLVELAQDLIGEGAGRPT